MESVSYWTHNDHDVDLVMEKRGQSKIFLNIILSLSTHLCNSAPMQRYITVYWPSLTLNDVSCKFWGWKMLKWDRNNCFLALIKQKQNTVAVKPSILVKQL